MAKFLRNYSLSIDTNDGGVLTVKLPLTVEFDIERKILSSASGATITIYNLSQNNRNLIRKDVIDYANTRKLTFSAGYGNNLSVAFTGYISHAWSVREGTNFITRISCYDGGFAFANAITNQAFPEDAAQNTVMETMMKSLPGTTFGALGSYPGFLSRGNSYSGSTPDILKDLSGGGFFIDNGKSYCLNESECIDGEVLVITPESGLLNTPILEQTILHFDMLFEPRLLIGQKVKLDSHTDQNFNGDYKVISLHHHGMMSDSVCGDAITQVGLWYGTKSLTVVQNG